jgi:hypothetical protein
VEHDRPALGVGQVGERSAQPLDALGPDDGLVEGALGRRLRRERPHDGADAQLALTLHQVVVREAVQPGGAVVRASGLGHARSPPSVSRTGGPPGSTVGDLVHAHGSKRPAAA